MKLFKVKNGKRRFTAVFVSALVLLCVSTGLLLGTGLFSILSAKAEQAQSYDIYSAADFIAYARAYAQGNRNPEDVLNISINSGDAITNGDFISIGTADRPFAGTLNVPSAGVDVFQLYDCPLFDYVSTDLKITGAGTVKITRVKPVDNPADGVLTSGSLFANHVVSGDAPANWNILLDTYTGENTASTSYESLIGDIAAGCDVTVLFTNNSSVAVSSAANAGLICGTLNAGAKLAVTTAGTASGINVTSTGGHAGGLVGEMKTGATLKYNSNNNSGVASVTSDNGFAGGVVGVADRIAVEYGSGVTDYAISGTISGKLGAGGVFGKYVTEESPVTFTLEDTYAIASSTVVTGDNNTAYTGGVFGLLENNGASFTFDGNSAGEVLNLSVSGGKYRGGVMGGYKTNALTNTFEILDTSVKLSSGIGNSFYSAGLIGAVTDDPAYINIHDVSVASKNNVTAGLIGTIGEGGSFIDATGNITIGEAPAAGAEAGKFDAGLIGNMPNGVLRMSGTFDLGQFVQYGTASGYLVKDRDRALVYALGDGEGTNGNWTFKRNTANYIDDIHSWGEVIRCDGTKLSESDLFTVDAATAHTVTVKAPVTAMDNIVDFAKTALNIKLNTGADVGALKFESSTRSATLLGGTLSVTDNIDLSGTGLLGLARDDGGNAAFSGTFNGNNKKITFATGEVYGLDANGNALASNSEQGHIHQHAYNGLFAETRGATVNNLILDGRFNIRQTVSTLYLGGVTAHASGGLTMSGVVVGTPVANSNETNFKIHAKLSGSAAPCYGGAIGIVDGVATVSASSCTFNPTVEDVSTAAGDGSNFYLGGAIGYVRADESASPAQHITISGSTLGLQYTAGTASRPTAFGSAIGGVSNCMYVKDNRTVNITNTSIDITANGRTYVASGSGTSTRKFGAILGMNWFASDVTLSGVTVSNCDITATGTAVDFGGLVRTATGHWDIQSITLTPGKANFNLPAGGTFGFVANKTSNNGTDAADNALYLDVNNQTSGSATNYNISALTFTGDPAFTVYDEIVADSRYELGDIVANGNSIISITTDGNTIADSDDTYLNQTAYGKQNVAAAKINANTRYYYNLAYARANVNTPKYKFLTWSVGIYAHSSLKDWFTVSDSTFTGDLDMTGLSYYPVDLTKGVTFNNATLKLDNVTMEGRVKYAYSGDGGARSTRSSNNQHYLMHTAVFRNDSASAINITGLTIQGNVPKLADDFCGFLVAGTFGNSDNTNAKFDASNIVFDGAKIVTSAGGDLTAADYTPLLINKVGKNTTLTIAGASQSTSAYTSLVSAGKYAASSMIGDVGSSTARAIKLKFTGLKFDGRSTAGSVGNLDTAYGTARSIFSRATILNSFLYSGESSGTYNYRFAEDWTDTSNPAHNVTYGKEVTSSVEFANLEKKYLGTVNGVAYYTDPTQVSTTDSYSFASGYLPYVYTAYNISQAKHELAVNISETSDIAGCGKYNDPYVIDDSSKLPILTQMMNGSDFEDVQIWLPDDLSNNAATTDYNYTSSSYTKYAFNENASQVFVSSGTNTTYAKDIVRRYLAGAYYTITVDITLPDNYVPLGEAATDTNPEYSFRGQLIGRGITVTNNSKNPLIKTAMGCLVKNLTVNVDVDIGNTHSHVIDLDAPAKDTLYYYTGGVKSYGAVIEKILGGDNIIDETHVTFTNATFSLTGTAKYRRLIPVGGYVGTLFNGGLIFRNMTSADVGLTTATFDKVAEPAYNSTEDVYLYVNPIIGRVMAGYAFHETTAYSATSTTLNNGTKNYVIPDLSTSWGKLTVSGSGPYTIQVPDGQAMFILGAAVNCGACCASDGTDIDNPTAYNSVNTNAGKYWQAYRPYATTRGLADYSGVGTSSGTDYNNVQKDKYTANYNKTPYIMRAYTVDGTSGAKLRSIAQGNGNTIQLDGDCNIAPGFRGIGSLYFNDSSNKNTFSNDVALRLAKFEGNSHKVTLRMRFLEYDHKNVEAYVTQTMNAGFGLFNYLQFKGADGENYYAKDVVLAGSVFHDVYKLSDGTRSPYKVATSLTEESVSGKLGNPSEEYYVSCGGLIGQIRSNSFYIKNVTFDGLTVEGAKCAGGIVGHPYNNSNSGSTPSIIEFDSSAPAGGWVSAIGGIQAGGLVGRTYETRLTITGDNYVLKVNRIENKSAELNDRVDNTYQDNRITGAGGIIGSCWGCHKISKSGVDTGTGTSPDIVIHGNAAGVNTRTTSITGITVKGVGEAKIAVINTTGAGLYNFAGGFIGNCHDTLLRITDCEVRDVDIKAHVAGGAVGHLSQKFFVFADNVTVDGSAKTYTIDGTAYAGGMFGWVKARDSRYISVTNSKVVGYNVLSSSTASSADCAAGGLIGVAFGESGADGRPDSATTMNTGNHIWEFINCTVSGCDITTKYNGGSNNCGTGGLVGSMTGQSNTIKICGYNIMIESVDLVHLNNGTTNQSVATNNRKIGDVIGNNASGNAVRFVAITTNNATYCGKHAGNFNNDTDNYGSNVFWGTGYTVFADYNSVQTNHEFSSIRDATAGADTYVNVAAADPYVNVNPAIEISRATQTTDAVLLTGDATATNLTGLPIYTIRSDYSANGSYARYAYAADYFYNNTNGVKNAAVFNDYVGKLAMFKSEATEYLGTDFPVLVLEDTNRDNSTKMINSYLRLLTNTRYDYAAENNANSDIYDVKIYNMVYNQAQSRFVPSLTGASLKNEEGKFYMLNSVFDSGKTQFSLIDVRYFDPGDKTTVAYHLYVPVFVKKVLSYRFEIAELSGTTYLKTPYEARFGQALLENVGTPVTLYFQYTYSRTAAEWLQAIEAGEDVDRNYAKQLMFYKANTNEALNDLPGNTILTLVDPNDGGKPYYAMLSNVLSGTTLNLGGFRDTATYNESTGTWSFSGANFAPQNLSALMPLKATYVQSPASGAITYVRTGTGAGLAPNTANAGTVTVGDHTYRLATDDDASYDKYLISFKDEVDTSQPLSPERYYLSIYTESNAVNDELFYFLITSPSSFNEVAYPSKIEDNGADKMVHLVMGKIFHHSDFSVTSDTDDHTTLITPVNDQLTINLSAKVGISEDLPAALKEDIERLVRATEVYQSFIVYLSRKENNIINKVILGDPTAAGTYNVSVPDADPEAAPNVLLSGSYTGNAANAGIIRQTQNYVEFVSADLSDQFATGDLFDITATVTLEYSSEAIPTQFPGRGVLPPSDTNGVTVSGSSNIAFQQEDTTFTKNTIGDEEGSLPQQARNSYYSESAPESATLDLNPVGDKFGDFTPLGINALNNNNGTVADMYLLASLKIDKIVDQVEGFTDAELIIQLSQKQPDGSYGTPVQTDYHISDYLAIDLEGINDQTVGASQTETDTSISIVVPASALDNNGASIEPPVIHCHVKTGSDFERAGYKYANYRLTVTMVLRGDGGAKINVSQASNFVIYTNAKIIPYFIVPGQQ